MNLFQFFPNKPKRITIPEDILWKIDEQFENEYDRQEAKYLIGHLWTTNLNVGAPQLARSILTLADGQLEDIREIVKGFYSDPRDVIMVAENKIGNPGHFFVPAFERILSKRPDNEASKSP